MLCLPRVALVHVLYAESRIFLHSFLITLICTTWHPACHHPYHAPILPHQVAQQMDSCGPRVLSHSIYIRILHHPFIWSTHKAWLHSMMHAKSITCLVQLLYCTAKISDVFSPWMGSWKSLPHSHSTSTSFCAMAMKEVIICCLSLAKWTSMITTDFWWNWNVDKTGLGHYDWLVQVVQESRFIGKGECRHYNALGSERDGWGRLPWGLLSGIRLLEHTEGRRDRTGCIYSQFTHSLLYTLLLGN